MSLAASRWGTTLGFKYNCGASTSWGSTWASMPARAALDFLSMSGPVLASLTACRAVHLGPKSRWASRSSRMALSGCTTVCQPDLGDAPALLTLLFHVMKGSPHLRSSTGSNESNTSLSSQGSDPLAPNPPTTAGSSNAACIENSVVLPKFLWPAHVGGGTRGAHWCGWEIRRRRNLHNMQHRPRLLVVEKRHALGLFLIPRNLPNLPALKHAVQYKRHCALSWSRAHGFCVSPQLSGCVACPFDPA